MRIDAFHIRQCNQSLAHTGLVGDDEQVKVRKQMPERRNGLRKEFHLRRIVQKAVILDQRTVTIQKDSGPTAPGTGIK